LNPTDTQAWVQSYIVSIYDGYSCPGGITVHGFIYLPAAGSSAGEPTFNEVDLQTGVSTLSLSFPTLTLATEHPEAVAVVLYPIHNHGLIVKVSFYRRH